jgi:hypothetical protein
MAEAEIRNPKLRQQVTKSGCCGLKELIKLEVSEHSGNIQ